MDDQGTARAGGNDMRDYNISRLIHATVSSVALTIALVIVYTIVRSCTRQARPVSHLNGDRVDGCRRSGSCCPEVAGFT